MLIFLPNLGMGAGTGSFRFRNAQTAEISFALAVAAGESIRVRAQKVNGTATVKTRKWASRIRILNSPALE